LRGLFKSTVLLAFVLTLLVPTTASANKYLAWLEELSGPGPFHGAVFTADVACIGSPPNDAESLGLFVYAAAKIEGASDADAALRFDTFMSPVYQRTDKQLIEGDVVELFKELRTQLLTANFDNPPVRSAVTAVLPTAAPSAIVGLWNEYERQQRRFRKCRVDRSNNIVSIQLEIGRYKDDLDDKRYEGTTRLTTITAVAYLPVERLFRWDWKRTLSPGGRFLEVGAGVGAYGLDGDTLRDEDLWRGVVPMRVRLIPSEIIYALYKPRKPGLDVSLNPRTEGNRWRRLFQAVEYRFGQDLVLGTLDSDLFSDAGPSTTNQKHEWVRSHGFNIDLGIAFRALIGH
jgi:hypothetical protein